MQWHKNRYFYLLNWVGRFKRGGYKYNAHRWADNSPSWEGNSHRGGGRTGEKVGENGSGDFGRRLFWTGEMEYPCVSASISLWEGSELERVGKLCVEIFHLFIGFICFFLSYMLTDESTLTITTKHVVNANRKTKWLAYKTRVLAL